MSNEPIVIQAPATVVPPEPKTPIPRVTESLSPRTTVQEDKTTAGQRLINMIWEGTQAIIAVQVVAANMVVGTWRGMGWVKDEKEFPFILSSALFLVIGFYFSRTNHAAIGGVGKKPVQEEYRGR